VVDVVLVHGTTQSPAGWGRLIVELESRGARAFAVDLQTERADMSTAQLVALARSQLPKDLTSPVVAAHSGSGLLLPAIAAELGARRQVWVAAAVPDAPGGRTFAAEAAQDRFAVINPEWAGVDPTSDAVLATYFLFHDSDLNTLRWALTTLRLFSSIAAAYAEPPCHDLHAVPSTFLLPRRDRTLQPAWMARVCWERLGVEPVELDAGHCPHVSVPAQVADLILDDAPRSSTNAA
jgi:pimeloyl-ACP methyl ester carboxylesterase